MPRTTALSKSTDKTRPDYIGLTNFLLKPFLESPDSLSLDCEKLNQEQKIWIRAAFESSDKGRVFGRGGRNIQAIRSVLETAAIMAGQTIHLEIYGDNEGYESHSYAPRREDNFKKGRRRHRTRRSVTSRPSLRSRLR